VPHVVTGIRVADPRWWRTALERTATALADRFVCVSQGVAEFCRQRGFSADKLVVIPNGVELSAFRDVQAANLEALGVPEGRRVILYVGRLDKQKGLDRFFRELPAAFHELPDHDLLIIGEGRLRSDLSRYVQEQGVGSRVHFAGWQPDVPPLISAAD